MKKCLYLELSWPENKHFICKEKYNSSGFSIFDYIKIENRFTCLVESKPVKQDVSRTLIISLTKQDEYQFFVLTNQFIVWSTPCGYFICNGGISDDFSSYW